MKKSVLVILSTIFLVSCQTGSQSSYSLLMPQPVEQLGTAPSDAVACRQLLAAYNDKNWGKVVKVGDQMRMKNESFGDALILYAEGLAAVGRSHEAISMLTDRIKREPENYMLVQTLGNIYMVNDEYASARKCFNRVIELNPRYARPYIYNGEALNLEGDSIGAADSYMHAICLFAENGLWQECALYAQRIMDLNPPSDDFCHAYIFQAAASWHLNQMDQYEEDRKVVELLGGVEGLQLLDELCKKTKE